jgi:hypothetical protein
LRDSLPKTALAIFKINVVRKVVHQCGQEMSFAGQSGRDAMSLCDVPTETDYVSSLVFYISANLETHFEETHRRAAKMSDLELASHATRARKQLA